MTKFIGLALLASTETLATGAQAAVVVHTASFIASPPYFNGFEGLGDQLGYAQPYTEGGIVVSYIGGSKIWSSSQAGQGQFSWYPDGGGYGYTDIMLASNKTFRKIQFLASSGFYSGNGNLAYELVDQGVVVASGIAGALPGYGAGFKAYGFSGISFNEVRLKGAIDATGFDASAFEAGAFDSIAISVPEPAGWALMIGGFGLAGAAMRRRRAMAPLHA